MLESHLGGLKRMDDMSVQEWVDTAKRAQEIFAIKETDDEVTRNNKESQIRWFSADDRF